MTLNSSDWEAIAEAQTRLPLDQYGRRSLLTELLGDMAGNGIFAGIAMIPGNADFFIELNEAIRVLQSDALSEKFVQILAKRAFNQSDKETLTKMLNRASTQHPGNLPVANSPVAPVSLRVLFMEAVPFFEQRLDTVSEYNSIVLALSNAQLLGRIDLIPPQYNASVHDLLSSMENFKPNLLHVSSHGRADRLLLMGDAGRTQQIAPEGLRDFLKGFKTQLHCCIFNACDSIDIARIVSTEIDFAIGYAGAYLDSNALAFSRAFYSQLSRDPSDFARAFLFGQSALRMLAPLAADCIKLYSKGQAVQT